VSLQEVVLEQDSSLALARFYLLLDQVSQPFCEREEALRCYTANDLLHYPSPVVDELHGYVPGRLGSDECAGRNDYLPSCPGCFYPLFCESFR
jgi:hypothetical protein